MSLAARSAPSNPPSPGSARPSERHEGRDSSRGLRVGPLRGGQRSGTVTRVLLVGRAGPVLPPVPRCTGAAPTFRRGASGRRRSDRSGGGRAAGARAVACRRRSCRCGHGLEPRAAREASRPSHRWSAPDAPDVHPGVCGFGSVICEPPRSRWITPLRYPECRCGEDRGHPGDARHLTGAGRGTTVAWDMHDSCRSRRPRSSRRAAASRPPTPPTAAPPPPSRHRRTSRQMRRGSWTAARTSSPTSRA